MIAQFIPSFWLTAFPLLVIAGIPLAAVIYWILSRLTFLTPKGWKSRFRLFSFSIACTAGLFFAINYLYWNHKEKTTPTSIEIRSLATDGATMQKFTTHFGEPSSRSKNANGNDLLEYPAIIKYSSGRRSVGFVSVEFNTAGNAIETWTAD